MGFITDMYHLCIAFYSEPGMQRFLGAISRAAEGEDPMHTGKMLLISTLVLLALGFAVDQVLYWTRPDHRQLMVRPWKLWQNRTGRHPQEKNQ